MLKARFVLLGFVALYVFLMVLAVDVRAQSRDYHDRDVIIYNHTRVPLMSFYASTVDSASWQEDILGDDYIDSRDWVIINIDDGSGYCLYDFKSVFLDGDVVTEDNVNVCEVGTYTIE